MFLKADASAVTLAIVSSRIAARIRCFFIQHILHGVMSLVILPWVHGLNDPAAGLRGVLITGQNCDCHLTFAGLSAALDVCDDDQSMAPTQSGIRNGYEKSVQSAVHISMI